MANAGRGRMFVEAAPFQMQVLARMWVLVGAARAGALLVVAEKRFAEAGWVAER